MSLANKEARAALMGDFDGEFMGDPGIFGSIGRFAGKVAKKAVNVGIDILPGPIGIAARTGRRALRGAPAGAGGGRLAPPPSIRRSRPGVGISIPGFRERGIQFGRRPSGRRLDIRGPGGTGVTLEEPQFFDGGGGGEVTVGAAGQPLPACNVGFHPNKSGYFRRSPAGGVVFIQPRSVCVRNRRIDPGNTRATKRAISRIRSAKRLKDALSGVTVHKKPC